MRTVRIRPASPADHARIGDLTLSAYLAGGFVDAGEPYAAHLGDTATRTAEADVWVAELLEERTGPVVAGTVTWCPAGSPWREIASDDEGEFRMLAVDPHLHRRGVARALVEHCVDLARAEGRVGVALSSLPAQTAAHGLYLSLGFVRDPDRDWSPAPGIDLRVFALQF
ncbi:GNAT family N-acetyltransferase [Nocardioides sp. CPCC 205120]|uniref:GNAT family N-acetyltransferase n=1 Tax=Nocardioides sp. CPCC 205120 TaxID=3406462 RepID=UPI003B5017A3